MASENLGRNLTFKIYNADGTSFHNLEMRKATYDSVVMSLSDKITGEVYYKDNTLAVTMSEYIEYNGTKFILVNPPTILREGLAKDNSELKGMTKYSFEFYHPMCKLANIPFTDVAVSNDEKRYKSQDKTFSWIGKGYDFIAKINKNIENTPWVVVPSTDGESMNKLSKLPSEILPTKAWEEKQNNVLSFDNNSIADALKVIYDSWGLPFVISPLSEGEYYNADNVDYYSEEGGSKRFVIIAGYPSNEIVDKDSEYGTVVNADTFMSGNIYYNTAPVTVPPNVKIVVESLEEGAVPVILNKTHNGVIGTTNRTFAEYTTVYIGLSHGTGKVRYSFDNSQNNVYVFRFGQGVGLKNNSRTPRNNKIITRIAGYGSTDNIPYGYPQIVWSGSPDAKTTPDGYPIYKGIVAGHSELLIKHPFTRTHLMPSIYSETVNRKVNPYATGYDPDIEIVDYYDADSTYPNPAVADAPSYEIHEFGGIKPELGVASIVDAKPLGTDNTTVVDEWDDTLDEEGNYVQSYFRITLPPLGFDIYASAAVTQEMKVNMRSGACIGCTFEVQVDWEDYKVNFYDSNAEFAPSGAQRDYQKYPDSTSSTISVTVKKEIETFGTLMPNIYQYPVSGDEFVIIGISMPLTYISNAERRLDDAMKSYMLGNNIYYYDYPLKFDEYFLSQRTDILSQIKPNSIIRFLFGDESQKLMLYVKQLTVKYGNNPLPQYDITLTDNIDVVLNSIGQVVDDVEKLGAVISELRRGDSGTGSSASGADKLSRVSDDVARGEIGFVKGLWVKAKGLFGIDAEGNLSANEGNFNGRVTANDMRSLNYTGSGIADIGWAIVNDNGSGSSQAIFDYLTIRKKMIVNSLEIKETHVTAGDIAQTCASADIVRTDYYEVDDRGNYTLLGYAKKKTPWYLRGMAVALGKRVVGSKWFSMFGHYKEIRVTLTAADLSRCNRIRCYFLAKDGEKEIENWFRVNDLIRCQTWNIVKASRQTYTPNLNDHDGNIFWWRKCVNVSWNTGTPQYFDPNGNKTANKSDAYVNEGGVARLATNGTYSATVDDAHAPKELDGNTYHWFDVAYDYYAEQNAFGEGKDTGWCAKDSDIPALGDKVVQFGNSTDPDRMNITLSEVNGSGNIDAPDIKMYRGVYTFNLERSWWGGVPCKIKISPATGCDFYAPHFRFITETGSARVPFDRPEKYWTSIAFERDEYNDADGYEYPDYSDDIKDGEGNFVSRFGGSAENPIAKNYVRKCYYYDRLTHNGSLWLCSIANETWYWRATADFGSYRRGDKVTDYSQLTDAEKDLCEHVRSYTNQEPSIGAGDWTRQVDKGDPGSFLSRAFCRTNTDIRSYHPQGGTIESPIPTSTKNADGEVVSGITWTDGAPDGDEILWSTTAWFYSDGTHSSWTAPAHETDTQTQDIEFSPSYYQPADPYGDDASQKDSDTYKTQRHSQGWYDPNDTLPSGTSWSDIIWRAERQIKNGAYSGEWSVSRVKGESSNRLDLTNQADLVSLDADGKVRFGRTVTTIARIFEGGTIATANVEKGSTLTAANMKYGSTSTCTVSDIVNGQVTITWNFKKGDTITATPRLIVMKLRNVEYSATFSLGTTDSEYIYQLNPSPSEISFSRTSTNTLTPSYVDLYCGYTKSNGSGTTTISNPTESKIDDNNYLYYRIKDSSGSWGSWTAYSGYIRVYSSTTNIDYELAISTASSWRNVSDSNAYEREVIPVVKDGENGSNADVPMQAFQWNTSPTTAPSPLPSGSNLGSWRATAPNRPTTTGDHYLWMTQTLKHTAKNGTVTYDTWSAATRISGDKGDAGEDASDQEFIYKRLTAYPFPSTETLPANIKKDKNGTTRSDSYIATTDDFVPYGWSDNALPATETEKYVYASIRTKASGHSESWNAFGTPFLWSNWGVQGIDGDGVQYVYKLFDHELTDAERTSNIPSKPASQNANGEWIPTGWNDDPLAPTSSMQFCYCSVIKKINGSWGSFEKLGLWSKWSENAIRVDLDNEMDSMLYDGAGNKLSSNIVSHAFLYDGVSNKTDSATWSLSASGCRISSTTGSTITVTEVISTDATVTATATYSNKTYSATMSIKKIVNADKFDLDVSPNALFLNTSDGWSSSKTITIKVMRTPAGGGTPTAVDYSDSTYGLTLSATLSDGTALTVSGSGTSRTITVTKTQATDNENIVITLYKTSSNNVYDRETIPFNKAENGDDGKTIRVVEAFKNSDSMPSKPTATSITDTTTDFGNGWGLTPINGKSIGSGTTTNQFLPTYTHYNYSLTEQIYTSSEIGVSAGKVKSISFYNSTYANTRNIEVYLVNTFKSTFSSTTDWIVPSKSNLVFSGSVTFVNGTWNTISFNKHFAYSGGNLAVIINDVTGSYVTTSYMRGYVFSASNQSLYAYRDNPGKYDALSPSSITGTRGSVKNQIRLGMGDVYVSVATFVDNAITEEGWSDPVLFLGSNGESGSEGLSGCVVRTSEWKSGQEYHNDEGDDTLEIRYLDVVAVVADNDDGYNFYRCKVTHTSSDSVTYADTTKWEALSNVGPIYTSLLVAKNAYIKFGTGNQFVITDSSGKNIQAGMKGDGNYRIWAGTSSSSVSDTNVGNAPFRVDKDGKLYASEAEISGKVTASEGKVGGWSIDGNTLKSTNAASILLDNNGNKFVRIQPVSSNQAGLVVRNDEGVAASFSGYGNDSTALKLIAQGGNNTTAIDSTGDAKFNIRSGEEFHICKYVDDYTYESLFKVGGNGNVSLPKSLITGSGDKELPTNASFGTVVFVKGTSGDITVRGTIMASNSGYNVSSLEIGRGSHMFIYDGLEWIHFNCSE